MIINVALSLQQEFALLDREVQEAWLAEQTLETLKEVNRGEWWWVARPEQVPPETAYSIFLYLAGRGAGKTRSGAEWIVERCLRYPLSMAGAPTEHMIVAESLDDARKVCMEGEAGVLRVLERKDLTAGKDFIYTRSPKPKIVLLEHGTKILTAGADNEDCGRGANNTSIWCIAENEPVYTKNGQIPIQNVRVGDEVMTRNGWASVSGAAKTGTAREILRIVTDAGDLRVTEEHLVWSSRGWIRAGLLSPGDTMATCLPYLDQSQAKLRPSASGTAKSGTTTSGPDITIAETDPCFIDQFGYPTTGRLKTATKSITSTVSAGTTESKIWKSSQSPTTESSPGNSETTFTRPTGPRGQSGPKITPTASGKSDSQELWSAWNARGSTSVPACVRSGVPTLVEKKEREKLRWTSVRSVEMERYRADVFDLKVEGAPEFCAGSGALLIHNCDEVVTWRKPERTWKEGLRPSLRGSIEGDRPRAFVTTTPKPIEILHMWLAKTDGSVAVSRGSTFDNVMGLPADFLEDMRNEYGNSALGRQELYGEMLENLEGALFGYNDINRTRVDIGPEKVTYRVVAVDPSLTGEEDGDEMGVVVAIRDHRDHMYVLEDASERLVGREAALHCWRVFERYECDVMTYENNLGHAWMQQVLVDAYRELQKEGFFPEHTNPPLKPVRSFQGKQLRAEPVAMRYQQGRIHMVGTFPELERQLVSWDPLSSRDSPDRLDAFVHACRLLMEGEKSKATIYSPAQYRVSALAPGTRRGSAIIRHM